MSLRKVASLVLRRDWSSWRIESVAKAASELLFPSPCVICDSTEGPLCRDCRDEVIGASASQCPRCAMAAGPWANLESGCSWCRDRRLGFDEAMALGPYQGPIRDLCLAMKHEHQAWRARWTADLLVEALGKSLRASHAGLVVAVPLHWRRRLRRGYNQADALAGHLAKRLGLPKVHALRRVLATPKLADRGRGERAELLRGAFVANQAVSLVGQTVLLVDDILTTGATCSAAARTLKLAGATKVVAVVIGRAEGRT